MSCNRTISRRAACLGLLTLAGCGLTPLYGGDVGSLRGRVGISAPDTVAGFALRDQLRARLGVPQTPAYLLTVTLEETPAPAAITAEGDTTRFSLLGRATWQLMQAGMLIGSGVEETFASYSATGSTVATQVAEDDARARLASALADLVVAQIILAAS